jgi:hypothetical protein
MSKLKDHFFWEICLNSERNAADEEDRKYYGGPGPALSKHLQIIAYLESWRAESPHRTIGRFYTPSDFADDEGERDDRLLNVYIANAAAHGYEAEATPPRLQEDIQQHILVTPPGWRARDILRVIYSKRTAEGVFDQVIADIREEWQEAMIAGHTRRACWIRIRGYGILALTIVTHGIGTVGAKVREFSKLT